MHLITVKDGSTFNRIKIQYQKIKDMPPGKVQFHCAVALQTVTMYRHNQVVWDVIMAVFIWFPSQSDLIPSTERLQAERYALTHKLIS